MSRADVLRAVFPRLVVLWFAGMTLRITVLALPPLLPRIHAELGLTQTALSALTTLPVLLLALGAPLGSAIVGRTGPRRTLLGGLALIAVSSALRGLWPNAGALFALTFLMGVAIAVVQPAMPGLVQRWVPRAAGRGTAAWVNGMLFGEVLAASLTLSLVVPSTGGWRPALATWSIPVLVAATLVVVVRDRQAGVGERSAGGQAAPDRVATAGQAEAGAARWLPDLRNRQTWRLGLLQGAPSAMYFVANTFLPTYLHSVGEPGLVGPALTTLNAAQLPASVLLALLPTALVVSPAVVASLGVLGLAGLALIVVAPGAMVLVGAGLVGFVAAAALTVALTLPVIVAAPGDAHRVSAGMFTIGYTLAFVLPLLGGVAWDTSGTPTLAYVPAFACAAGMVILARGMRSRRSPAP